MPFRMGPWEIALIVVIILIVFGVGKLPQVGAAFGKGIRAFKRGQSDDEEAVEEKPKKKTRRKRRKTVKKPAAETTGDDTASTAS